MSRNWLLHSADADRQARSPAKPSRPSRAYLHLTKQEHTNTLSEKVRNSLFIDAKGSTKDACLLGPPSVEFAPFGRIPNGRPRKDARQGTIDQDSEFIDFLESLTNPVAKPITVDQENDAAKGKERVTVTPLVQFLKDKKANKGKEPTAAKGVKQARQDKGEKAAEGKMTAQAVPSPKKRSAQAVKVEQAARDAVKALNKQAANAKGAIPAVTTSKTQKVGPNASPNSAANAALAGKQRERGNVSAAAKILQRDLGIGGNVRGRGGRHGPTNTPGRNSTNGHTADKPITASPSTQAPQPAKSETNETSISAPASVVANGQETTPQPPTEPAANRVPSKPAAQNTSQQSTSKTQISSTSTQAFLKHANPSQGITEPLLEEAFKEFGAVNNVEIDKKKGFAYVEFAEPESLQKAIRASPIKVAQGQVQVLERKTGTTLQARNNARSAGPVANNSNMRGGGGSVGSNNARGGPAMGNHNMRGVSAMHNRGGMPIGGRGGHVRGRGGLGRGGNMPRGNQAKSGGPASTASATPATTDSQPTSSTASAPVAPAAPTEPTGS